MNMEILGCLKRKRDICVKAVITSQNTAFMWTLALIWYISCLCSESICATRIFFRGHLVFLYRDLKKHNVKENGREQELSGKEVAKKIAKGGETVLNTVQ